MRWQRIVNWPAPKGLTRPWTNFILMPSLDQLEVRRGLPTWSPAITSAEEVRAPRRSRAIPTSMGLPVGISFFGRAWSEPTLIRLAYSFEQATKARHVPRFLPTIGPA